MFNIRRVMYKISGALLAVLFVLMSASPVWASSDVDQESPFKTHLSDVEIKDQNAVPQDTTTDTAIPPVDSVNPEGTNQEQNRNPDSNSDHNSSTPEGSTPGKTDTKGNSSNGTNGTNSGRGSTDDVTTPSPTPSGGVSTPAPAHPEGTDTSGTQVDGTHTEGTSTDKPDQDTVSTPDNRPWYEQLWDKGKEIAANPIESLKNFAKGAGAGAIGAAIVIGVVVVVALIISAPISVPLLIVAGVVGIVAGGIYGLMAGDDFEFIKGIGYGAMATLSVIGIAQTGIVSAGRGLFQLFRSSPTVMSAIREIGVRSLTYFQGAGTGLINGLRSFATAPIKSITSSLFTKEMAIGTFINFGISTFSKIAYDGELPSLQDAGVTLLEAVTGGVLFDKFAKVLKIPAVSKFGKTVASFTANMAQSLILSPIKALIKNEENASIGSQLKDAVVGSLVMAPIFGRILNNTRSKLDIRTASSDLEDAGIKPSVNRTRVSGILTNNQLSLWWNRLDKPGDIHPNSLNRWDNRKNQITENQLRQLEAQEKRLQQVQQPLGYVESFVGEHINKVVESLSTPNDAPQKEIDSNSKEK